MTSVESMDVNEEKKREKKMKNTVIDCFAKLVNDNDKVRVKNGAQLVKHLKINEETENGAKEIKYALNRLIRGAGATKNSSRIGFYTALCGFLQNVEADVDEVLSYVEKELHTSGNNSKSENADILTGHTMVCGAILRSGIFGKTTKSNKQKVIEMLMNSGKKKTYLTLISYTFIIEAFETISKEEFQTIVLPILRPEINKNLKELSLDQLYFLLKAHDKYPSVLNTKFLRNTVHCNEIVSAETVADITEILMHVLPIKQLLQHPVYDIAVNQLATSDHVSIFITEIDKQLNRPTLMNHQVATLILTKLAVNLQDKSVLPEVLTKNYLQLTLSHFRTISNKNQDDLQLSIYKLFEVLVLKLQQDCKTKIKLAVMKRLMFYPGTFIFEKLSRSKVLQQITATLDVEGVKKLALVYKSVLLSETEKHKNETETESWLNLDRTYAAQLIVKLLSHPSVKGEVDWKVEQLKLLLEVGLLKKEEHASVGTELAASIKDTFFRALDIKLPKLEDLCNVLSQLVHHLNAQFEDDRNAVLRNPLGDEEYAIWIKSLEAIGKLEKRTKKSHLSPVFKTLFLNLSLQLFSNAKLASESLKELFACYERTKAEKKSRKSGDFDGEVTDDVKWIEVVVDLFLNLLSHSSHLLRSLIGCVFPHLCKDLTLDAVHQILSVLDPKSDINPLSQESDESDDDENDAENEDESSDEDNESDGDDEQETVSDKLRQAVSEALGNDAALTDTESIDMDNMSDGECEKLNTALGAAFKQFKPNMGKKSKKQNKDEETLTHFRVRVLDLIDLYLDSDVTMLVCLEIMLPLLQVLDFSIRDQHQKPLSDRVKFCLKKLANLRKFASTDDVSDKIICDLLKSLLEKGTKVPFIIQEMGERVSDCCIFLLRSAQYLTVAESTPKKTKKKLRSGLNEILTDSLETFFSKRDCLIPYVLFKTLLNQNWEGNINLAEKLVSYIYNKDIRPFRRSQALELLRIFYLNNRLLSANSEIFSDKISEIETEIFSKTINLLENDQKLIREKYLSGLFNLLTAIKNSQHKSNSIDWPKIAETIREYRSGVSLSKDAKNAFGKLCGALKVSKIVKMKTTIVKLNNTNEDEACSIASEKEKKRKKNKESQKLKKQTQLERMKNHSEGFASVSFSGLKEENAMEVVVDEEGKSNKGKHLKAKKMLEHEEESSHEEDESDSDAEEEGDEIVDEEDESSCDELSDSADEEVELESKVANGFQNGTCKRKLVTHSTSAKKKLKK